MPANFLRLICLAVTFAVVGCAANGDTTAPQAMTDKPVPNPRTVEPPPAVTCDTLESVVTNPGDYVIIDARSPSEFDDGHVATAVNVPFDSVAGYADMLPADKDAAIFTYCRSGRRANVLKGILGDMGYTNITAVPGEQTVAVDDGLSFGCP